MVSLEQIRALEARVEKAVLLIEKLRKENADLEQRLIEASRGEERLREVEQKVAIAELKATEAEKRAAELANTAQTLEAENASLRERTAGAEQKAAELETRAEQLRHEQGRIEEGLAHALEKLDAFEDLVMGISLSDAGQDEGAVSESSISDEKADVLGDQAEHELDIF